jgi:hypothetical protein
MKKQHREIQFGLGKVDKAVEELARYKERGELVFGVFNGQKLYSDTDDLDSAYKKVTGKTKAEFDDMLDKSQRDYEEQKAAHKAAIPQLTIEWIEKGNAILDAKYHELWAKCVPIRLGDLYQGMELGNCLDIVKVLNDGGELEAAKDLIVNQGHSGMSFSLVRSMVRSFCDRGEEFVAITN